MLQIGSKAPDFEISGIDENGGERIFSLKELLAQNKNIVLYAYPKDNTPGCTQEACDFRDNFNRLISKALVVGVSPDSIAGHKKFMEKQGLNFILLSDPEHKILEPYGVWGEKTMCGKKYMGVIRSTFIIAPDGTVKKSWNNVKVKGHVEEILKVLG